MFKLLTETLTQLKVVKVQVHSQIYIAPIQFNKSYFEFLARSQNLSLFNNLSNQLAIDELERKLKYQFYFRLLFSILCYIILFVHSL